MEQGAFNTGKGVPCGTNVEGHVHLENERVVRLAKQIIEVWQAQQQGSEQSLAAQCQDCTQSPSNMQNVGFTKLTSPQPPSPQSPVVGSLNDVFNKNFSSFSGSMDAFSGQFRRQFIGQPVCESGYGRRQSQSEILRQYIGQQEQISQSLDDFNDGLPNDVPVGQQSGSGINEYAMYQLFRQQMLGQQGAQQQPVQRQQEVDNLTSLFQELNVGLSSSTSSNVPFVEAHMDPAFGVQQGVGSRFVQPQQVQQQQQQQQEVEPLIDLTSQVPVGEGLGGSGRIGPSLVPREIKLERPSTFEGKHEQLENFLFEIQQYIDIVGLGTGARACQFFVSYLKGDAATWWRTYSMSKSRSGGSIFENLDLDTIVEELRQQFSDVDKLMHVRDKLFKLRQFGKVSQYTALFRRLQIELGDERLDDENAKYLYIRGLKQEVQNQVLLHRPDTFEDVVFCAERAGQAFELASGTNHSQRGGFGNGRGKFGGNRGGFQGKSRGNFGGYRGGFGRQQFGGSYQQQRGGYTQYNDHSNRGSGPMVLGSLEQQLLALSGQQKQQKQQKSSVVCWYCNKSGHTKKQCFKWQRDNGVSGGSGQQSGDVASQLALILSNLQKSGQQQPQQPQQQNKDKGQQSKN